VLSNKQTRAPSPSRMESIIQDGLPKGAYEFQFTLKKASARTAWCCADHGRW